MDKNTGLIKMKKNIGPIICALIFIMDIVAGILAIEAEIAQNKVGWNSDPSKQKWNNFNSLILLLFYFYWTGEESDDVGSWV